MGGFLLTSGFTIGLIVITSVLTYEMMRFAWRGMGGARYRHGRLVYSLAAAFIAHIASIWIYGTAYYLMIHYTGIGTLRDVTSAGGMDTVTLLHCAYFSAATYTSLGFGDVVPTGNLRMVAGAEALNGLLLIGWSATFSFLGMEEFREKPGSEFRRHMER